MPGIAHGPSTVSLSYVSSAATGVTTQLVLHGF